MIIVAISYSLVNQGHGTHGIQNYSEKPMIEIKV